MRDDFESYSKVMCSKISEAKKEAETLKQKQAEEEKMEALRLKLEARLVLSPNTEAAAVAVPKPRVETEVVAKKSKNDEVTAKIGHEKETSESEVKRKKDEEEEAEKEQLDRIEAIKKDLEKFYGDVDKEETRPDATTPKQQPPQPQPQQQPQRNSVSVRKSKSVDLVEVDAERTSAVSKAVTIDGDKSKRSLDCKETGVKQQVQPSSRFWPPEETVKLRRISKSERCTPERPVSMPAASTIRSLRKKSCDDLVRATNPIFQIPEPISKRNRRRSLAPAEPPVTPLPSVDQIVKIADAKTLPYSLTTEPFSLLLGGGGHKQR